MDARLIVQEAGMSERPAYYSGRGTVTSDLNSMILTKIAALIEKHHGEDAKKNFVKMVAGLKEANATDFLNELYMLEGNNWKYREQIHKTGNDVGDHDTSLGAAFATIIDTKAGSRNVDQTSAIRDQFLRSNGIKVKGKDQYREHGGFGYYHNSREW